MLFPRKHCFSSCIYATLEEPVSWLMGPDLLATPSLRCRAGSGFLWLSSPITVAGTAPDFHRFPRILKRTDNNYIIKLSLCQVSMLNPLCRSNRRSVHSSSEIPSPAHKGYYLLFLSIPFHMPDGFLCQH